MCCPQTSKEIHFYTRTRHNISQLQSISKVSAISFDAGVNSFLHGIDGAAQLVNVEIVPNFYQISSQILQVFQISTRELLFHKATNRKLQLIEIRAIERP
ncbi:hypothetical protein Y032_0006g2795 [Ancylostoma ceylanicum]|uniref:Uncharacterized protein n=1 Tax=Ancylostoma ceylanicum TaxID=53326 RepID=A0A016VNG6_9BILA|nr:hypothetical protein Y032_0006g2795 [Ancylostoma ceylanicum]